MDKLLTIADASALLQISPKHFRREFVNTGRVQVVSLGKGARGDRLDLAEINKLIRGQTRCYTKGEISGGSNSRLPAESYNDPLGLPAGGKRKRSNEKSEPRLQKNCTRDAPGRQALGPIRTLC